VRSYEVEFSKPHPLKPIPEGTVKVFFALIQMTNGETAVEFNFENESLRHQLDNTMRTNMFEVTLSSSLTIEMDRPRPREQAQDQEPAPSRH